MLRTYPGPAEGASAAAERIAHQVIGLDDELRMHPSPSLLADLKQRPGPGGSATISPR